MDTGARFPVGCLTSPGYRRLHEFNFLPSRYIHPQHASTLLPEFWSVQLGDGRLTARVHFHLSAYLLDRLQIKNAWVFSVDDLATKLALLPASLLEALAFRMGLALAGNEIRRCVRREHVKLLDEALEPEEWRFVFGIASLEVPTISLAEDDLFVAPREVLSMLGRAALECIVAELDRSARVRFDLKLPAMRSLPVLKKDGLEKLSVAILDQLEPAWDSSFSKTSTQAA